jgi:nucleoid-associated protein YgaU
MSTSVALEHAGASKPTSGSYVGPARATLDKATLHVHEPQPKGSSGAYEIGGELFSVPFQFNPKELTFSKSAKWPRQQAKAAKKAAAPEFSGSEPVKLSMEMFFDASAEHDGSVVKAVEQLMTCCMPTEQSIKDKKPRPPLVRLIWGSITGFTGFVTQVSAKFTLFAPDGTPLRATCSVSVEEMPPPEPKQNPTSGSIEVRGRYKLVSSDSLASVAYREYHDAAAWRAIADFNGIDDPIRVRAGDAILLPIESGLG